MQSYRIFVVMCMTRIIFPSCTLCDYWRVYQRCYDAIRGVTMLVGTLRVELHIPYTCTPTIHCWYTDTKPFASVCKYLMYALTQTYTVSINSNWSTGFIPVPKHGGAKPWYLSKKYVMSFHAMVCAHLPTYEEASSIKWQHISQCHATTDAWAYEFPMKGLHSPDI